MSRRVIFRWIEDGRIYRWLIVRIEQIDSIELVGDDRVEQLEIGMRDGLRRVNLDPPNRQQDYKLRTPYRDLAHSMVGDLFAAADDGDVTWTYNPSAAKPLMADWTSVFATTGWERDACF